MTNAIDLSMVRAGRTELDRLARTYPQLRGQRGPSNVEHWIETIGAPVDIAKTCEFCGKGFLATRKDARFCSDAHRTAANRRKDERGPSELAAALMKAAQLDEMYQASIGFPDAAKHKRLRDQALRDVHAAIVAELHIVPEPSPELEEPSPELEELVLVPPTSPGDLRRKLGEFMKEKHVSQGRVAELCGMNQSNVSRFLTGNTDLSDEKRKALERMIDARR